MAMIQQVDVDVQDITGLTHTNAHTETQDSGEADT